MIAMVDYGVGNLFSLKSSLAHLGLEAVVTADPARLRAADRIILPGVGAFGDAMEKLTATGLVPVIKEEARKKPLLGICLGMQLLFEKSYEYGEHQGIHQFVHGGERLQPGVGTYEGIADEDERSDEEHIERELDRRQAQRRLVDHHDIHGIGERRYDDEEHADGGQCGSVATLV